MLHTAKAVFTRFLGNQLSHNGTLYFGDTSAEELAHKYATPLYVLDEDDFRSKCKEFRAAAPDAHISYASKANSAIGVLAIAKEEGLDVDVASMGEMEAALRAGFTPEQITLHGSNKSDEELAEAVKLQIGRIVIDNLSEFARIKPNARVMLRLAPGVDPDTHEAISTGQEDTKFGFNIADGSAAEALKLVQQNALQLVGLHCHVGSQLMDSSAHLVAIGRMAQFAQDHSIELKELCIGGGLGIRYTERDTPQSVNDHCRALRQALPKGVRLGLEPGRALVGEAGTTLYKIGPIKKTASRTYISVDGGLADNPRPQLYGATYTALNASRLDEPHDTPFRISGRHCETDTLIPETRLPAKTKEGDFLAVQCTGAYNLAMASNYNRYPRPAMVIVGKNGTRLAVRRESIDDLFRTEADMS